MDESYANERLEVEGSRRQRLSHNQIIFSQIKTLVEDMVNKKVMRSCKHELLHVSGLI